MTTMKRRILAGVVLIVMLTGGAVAGPYEEGINATLSGDFGAAVKWYTLAAEQGHAKAQFSLGLMYEAGRVVPQDFAVAVKWYTLAAEQGHPRAQSYLGRMYAEGEGVPVDYVRAYMWLNLSVPGFSWPQEAESDITAQYRDRVAAKLSPDQLAEAQKLAREWKPAKQVMP